MGLELVALAFCSVILTYQGLAARELLWKFQPLSIGVSDSNLFIWICNIETLKWGIFLGVIGVVFVVGSLVEDKISKSSDKKISKLSGISDVVIYFIFVVVSIL